MGRGERWRRRWSFWPWAVWCQLEPGRGQGDIVPGRPSVESQQALPGPTLVLPEKGAASETPPDPHPAPRAGHGRAVRVADVRWPDASPYGDAVTFHSDTPVPDSLVFLLVVVPMRRRIRSVSLAT